jgi:hypothetical protein
MHGNIPDALAKTNVRMSLFFLVYRCCFEVLGGLIFNGKKFLVFLKKRQGDSLFIIL